MRPVMLKEGKGDVAILVILTIEVRTMRLTLVSTIFFVTMMVWISQNRRRQRIRSSVEIGKAFVSLTLTLRRAQQGLPELKSDQQPGRCRRECRRYHPGGCSQWHRRRDRRRGRIVRYIGPIQPRAHHRFARRRLGTARNREHQPCCQNETTPHCPYPGSPATRTASRAAAIRAPALARHSASS